MCFFFLCCIMCFILIVFFFFFFFFVFFFFFFFQAEDGIRDADVTGVQTCALPISGDARLIQNINYYEVPLELQYAVLDSRFGLSLIGGVSTLFLGNNEVSVKSNNFNSVLGAANNLSSVSFSTNVGLGLNYKLSKRFVFNVEPMFKYQLNPYTDSSVDFKPYYLGVYSGLSFKF